MIRHFCDMCKIELPKPYYLYTIGWTLCAQCHPKYVKENSIGKILICRRPKESL